MINIRHLTEESKESASFFFFIAHFTKKQTNSHRNTTLP